MAGLEREVTGALERECKIKLDLVMKISLALTGRPLAPQMLVAAERARDFFLSWQMFIAMRFSIRDAILVSSIRLSAIAEYGTVRQ